MSGNDSQLIETKTPVKSNTLHTLESTQTRELPSMTSEKFANNKIITAKETNDVSNETNESKLLDLSPNLNFNSTPPILNRFQDPFEETPEDKNDSNRHGNENENENEHENNNNDKTSKFNLFKTPSKSPMQHSNLNNKLELLHFFKDSTTPNAADEFRALKEKQKTALAFEYDDDSEPGFVIDIRKSEFYDDSIIGDDSSIKLNLAPVKNHQPKNNIIDDFIEPTQTDGNIHEEVNKMIHRHLSSKLKFPGDNQNDTPADNIPENIENSFRYDNSQIEDKTIIYDDKTNEETDKNDNTNDTILNGLDLEKDTMEIILSNENQDVKDQIIYSGGPIKKTKSKERRTMSSFQPFISSTQDISHEDLNDLDNEGLHQKFKDTQLIYNSSQSIVLEDEENEEKQENNDKEIIPEIDDDIEDGILKRGRNILQTFKLIDESQSQNKIEQPIISTSQAEFEISAPSIESESEPLKLAEPLIPDTLQLSNDSSEKNTNDNLNVNSNNGNNNNGDIVVENINNPSSPVLFIQQFESNENGNDDGNDEIVEVPNTSSLSISKLCVNGKDSKSSDKSNSSLKTNGSQISSSTPLKNKDKDKDTTKNKKDYGKEKEKLLKDCIQINTNDNLCHSNQDDNDKENITNEISVIEKLNDVLIFEQKEKESKNANGNGNGKLYEIIRDPINQKLRITDVLDKTGIFLMNNALRIPGMITKIVQSDDTVLVSVKVKEDEIIIESSKIYAPLCFDIGDSVKYDKDKKFYYTVTGLRKSNNDQTIKTVDGFDEVFIKKKPTKLSVREGADFDEIKVNVEDLYLTGPIARYYKYKLFNDQDDFYRYIDYQINKFEMMSRNNEGKIDLNKINADDTLLKLLPANKENNVKNNYKNNLFSKCLFIFTGINDCTIGGIRNQSKNSTPRHNLDKNGLNNIIQFITMNGGTILQDELAFEELIKFKTKEMNNYNAISIRSFSSFTSPSRRAKNKNRNNNISNNNNGSTNKEKVEFKNYNCSEDKDNYYLLDFKAGKEDEFIELDENFKNFEFCCVLTSKHSRTLKYLQCLCLKWPVLHIEFIKQCMINENNYLYNWKEEWNKYLLISGENNLLNCSFSIDIIKYYINWNNGYKLYQQLNNNDTFRGKSIIIIEDTLKDFKYKRKRIRSDNKGTDDVHKRRKLQNGFPETDAVNDVSTEKKEQVVKEEDSELDGESEEEEDDESKDLVDGPKRTETLIWMFRHMGFDKIIGLKNSEKLEEILKKYQSDIIYIKYGHNIHGFAKHIGLDKEEVKYVNWEWVVQHLILGGRVT